MDLLQLAIEMLRNPKKDRLNGVSRAIDMQRREFLSALSDYDDFVEDALAVDDGIHLGDAMSSEGEVIPIRLPWDDEHVHWIFQGATGSGKTRQAESVFVQKIMQRRPGVGGVDGKWDFFESEIRWTAAVAHTLGEQRKEELRKRLVVFNSFAEALAPFNVCRKLPGCTSEYQAYEIALALSRLFENELGVHQENILRHTIMLLIESGLSLVEAPLILRDEILRGVLAMRCPHPAVKEFFLQNYQSLPQASKDALFNRINALLLSESIRLMLGADGLLDLGTIFKRGDILAAFLGKGPGVAEELVEVFAKLFLQMLFQAIYAGGSAPGPGYLIFFDEYHQLVESPMMMKRFQTALTSARSYRRFVALINQNFVQCSPALREIILGNCDLALLFRTNARNAEFFGDFLPKIDPEIAAKAWASGKTELKPTRREQLEAVQRLPRQQCYLYDRRKPHRAIRIRVPDVPEPHEFAGLTEKALDDIIHIDGWDHGSAAIPRAELRAQIERRHRKLRELVNPPVVVSERKPQSAKSESSTTRNKPRLG